MALLQIKDPLANHSGNTTTQEEVAIGIDLGTTYSVIATYLKGQVEIIKNQGQRTTPSVVALKHDQILVGQPAANLSAHQSSPGEECTVIRSIKRLMGHNLENLAEEQVKNLGLASKQSGLWGGATGTQLGTTKSVNFKGLRPELISSYILKDLKRAAEVKLQKPITKAVITVPAYFSEQARAATKHAAQLAGLEVLRLINEPTAAALAYGLHQQPSGTYLVYDFGGGTFDVSVITLNKGVFRVLAAGGDLNIGGDDIDQLIANFLHTQSSLNSLVEGLDYQQSTLLLAARKLKETLSSQPNASAELPLLTKPSNSVTLSLTDRELVSLSSNLVNKTLELCHLALRDANLQAEDLAGIILVGGTTRLHGLKLQLSEAFKVPIYDHLNPDEVVAIGATYQAANLVRSMKNSSLLLDITPLSLGIETYGGAFEKIIYRNSPLPISKTQTFTTLKNNQTALSLHVLQGERELAKDNSSLAKFSLRGIPKMPAGTAKIEVTFTLDVDGLLTVKAQEQNLKSVATIEIKPSFGLSEENVRHMIMEALQSAGPDIEAKMLADNKTKAQQLINMVLHILKEESTLLLPGEEQQIKAQIRNLEATMKTATNSAVIKIAINLLNESTNSLAQRKLDKALAKNKTLK